MEEVKATSPRATEPKVSEPAPGSARELIFIDPPLRVKLEAAPPDPPFDDVFDETGEGPPVTAQEIQDVFDRLIAVTAAFVLLALSVTQGTPEWLRARLHRVGASVFNSMRGASAVAPRGRTMTGMMYLRDEDEATPFACAQGHRNEPLCEEACIANYKEVENHRRALADLPLITHIEVDHDGTLIWQEHPMFNASTDGVAWVFLEDGTVDLFLCEWKCPLVSGGYRGWVPETYWWQMQQQMTIYRRSGRLKDMAKARGIDLAKRLVPDWRLRCMFGVWQNGLVLQRQFVPHEEEQYMVEMRRVKQVYMAQYLPRLVRMLRGDVKKPCIDWAPPSHGVANLALTDDEDEFLPSDSEAGASADPQDILGLAHGTVGSEPEDEGAAEIGHRDDPEGQSVAQLLARHAAALSEDIGSDEEGDAPAQYLYAEGDSDDDEEEEEAAASFGAVSSGVDALFV